MLDVLQAYDDHVWDVYGFLSYRLGDPTHAEDLTQQTYERALRSACRFDPQRGSARAWLLAIANNLLNDHYRLGSTSREISSDVIEPPGTQSGPEVNLGVTPELETALATLQPREREIIALRFGGDLQGKEIAELLGLTLANVQQILSRSLRKLRAVLDQAPV